MFSLRTSTFAGLIIVTAALTGNSPAFAAHTYIEGRSSARYEVSPAMMHAIDIIVAEKMRMMRRRH